MIQRLRSWYLTHIVLPQPAKVNLARNHARELALIGVAKRRQPFRETAAKMRRELGLRPDRRLSA